MAYVFLSVLCDQSKADDEGIDFSQEKDFYVRIMTDSTPTVKNSKQKWIRLFRTKQVDFSRLEAMILDICRDKEPIIDDITFYVDKELAYQYIRKYAHIRDIFYNEYLLAKYLFLELELELESESASDSLIYDVLRQV